jgi:hypothetical protein
MDHPIWRKVMPRLAEVLDRFKLTNEQSSTDPVVRNVYWFLGDRRIGHGDLSRENIEWIMLELKDDEEFVGWIEKQGKNDALRNYPMIRITNRVVRYRGDILNEELPE